jgi:hypothetical protein
MVHRLVIGETRPTATFVANELPKAETLGDIFSLLKISVALSQAKR